VVKLQGFWGFEVVLGIVGGQWSSCWVVLVVVDHGGQVIGLEC